MTDVSQDTAARTHAPVEKPRADRILRWPDVQPLVGVSRTTWWRLVRSGAAPSPRRISPGCIGWMEGEIAAFQAARATQSEVA